MTPERLRELFYYDPETGDFTRRVTVRSSVAGSLAGGRNNNGYWNIKVDRRLYLAHRLAWLYVHGVWPKDEIDHINGDPLDNRLVNLREATRAENMANCKRRVDCKSGFKGVSWHKDAKKWAAYIGIGRKARHLGLFETREMAAAAHWQAAQELHGEFARAE